MIIDNYSAFRHFVNPGGTVDRDGLPEFPVAKMRFSTFVSGFQLSSTSAFPLSISCNFGDTDAVVNIDEFDWYVSQRTSIAANKPLTVSRKDTAPNTNSGTIEIDLSAWAATEYPDPFGISTIPILFSAIDIYAIRRFDLAIQRLDLRAYLYNANSPKTDVG